MMRQIVSVKSFVGCLGCEARQPAIIRIAALQRSSCAATNVFFGCRHFRARISWPRSVSWVSSRWLRLLCAEVRKKFAWGSPMLFAC